MKIPDRIDFILGKIAKVLLILFVMAIIYVIIHKRVEGEWMMYEDYYENKINKH